VIPNAKAVQQIHKLRTTSIRLNPRIFEYKESEQTVGIPLISGRKQFKVSMGWRCSDCIVAWSKFDERNAL
jgi:putative transposase